MDDPAGRQIVQASAEGGEQARLLPQVPMKMKLADYTTAMLPLTATGMAGALVVRAPVIAGALRSTSSCCGNGRPRSARTGVPHRVTGSPPPSRTCWN